ncbi:hypothetical protein PENANT_c007G02550 [Penicillium antarcticum]|uniref:Uncharacterized protein n=1 Tax=Penicillium antarcticum TaxID=416450 RepID=A0A1V6QBR4_9EURO|nr:uncharacterized protein N7508_003680 [Penicillium antarcticum]KAJ5312850.1 hypothetical protein N7508_003680 [Penicillium antarcticum]OQD86668.1 hypothetical protein PENANT_c007G02550 [Penicillium antarcticum]
MSGNEEPLVKSTLASSAAPPGQPEAEASAPSGNGPQPSKAGRRRRAPDSKNKPPKSQHFYFVDSNSSSKEKRAHVMRHHVQEKKKQRKMSHGSAEQASGGIAWPMKADAGLIADTESDTSSTAQEPSDSQFSQLQIRFSNVKPPSQSLPLHIGSPVTILDASRKDPFDSLPMEYDREDLELADLWTNKLTYWSGQNLYLKNQIFRTAMGNPLSFKAVVLAYCARWKAQLYGMTDSLEIQRHVGQATKLIEEATSGSMEVKPDDLAMALAGMALHEERFGSKQKAQDHVNRAVQLMRPRTGTNMPVETFIHYVRYIMTPEIPKINQSEQNWLLTFLRGAENLMQRQSTPGYLSKAPHRFKAFQMESPLFSLLSSGPRPSQVPQAWRIYVVRDAQTQEVSRTAALIYITAALWYFQDSPDKTDRFLAQVCAMVKQHHLDQDPACETLLWLLLEEGYDSDLRDPERGWSTGELLQCHKQLRPDLQFQFNEILMSFLSLHTPIRGVNVFEEELHSQ